VATTDTGAAAHVAMAREVKPLPAPNSTVTALLLVGAEAGSRRRDSSASTAATWLDDHTYAHRSHWPLKAGAAVTSREASATRQRCTVCSPTGTSVSTSLGSCQASERQGR
jgi:hypothetical protein